MLFRKDAWPGLTDGTITVAFRRQRKPTVKAGRTLRTPAGMLAIDAVDLIAESRITKADARRAGHADVADLLVALGPADPDRQLYRVRFHHIGDDPRIELRQQADLTADELDALVGRLDRLDRVAPSPWTAATMDVIAANPEVVSTVLAERLGQDRPPFKLNVRKLKGLGLTESLTVGYRLSPRGEAVRRHRAGNSATGA